MIPIHRLRDNYSKFEKLGDNLVAVPDHWDGDVTKLRTIAGVPSQEDMLRRQLLRQQIMSTGLGNQKAQAELDAAKTAPDKAAEMKQKALGLAQELRGLDENGNPKDVTGKSSAVGASFAKLLPFGQTMGLQGNRTAFEAKVNSLKSNLTLDNLKLLKGAMSDKDLLFLNSVGSSLDVNMSETEFDNELDKIIKTLGGTTDTAASQLQPGEMLVKDKATGQIGAIPAGEFDEQLYERQ